MTKLFYLNQNFERSEFSRDENYSLENVFLSDLVFNYAPLCEAYSNSMFEDGEDVNQGFIDAAQELVVCVSNIQRVGYDGDPTAQDFVNDFLNRV